MFSSCALPERGRASATNVNKLTDFQYASLFSALNNVTVSGEICTPNDVITSIWSHVRAAIILSLSFPLLADSLSIPLFSLSLLVAKVSERLMKPSPTHLFPAAVLLEDCSSPVRAHVIYVVGVRDAQGTAGFRLVWDDKCHLEPICFMVCM